MLTKRCFEGPCPAWPVTSLRGTMGSMINGNGTCVAGGGGGGGREKLGLFRVFP